MENIEASPKVADSVPSKVLIVDDDPTQCSAMTKLLKDKGATEVVAVENGEEGWKLLQKISFDFIILDWKMMPLSGANLLHRIRADKLLVETPVLVVSGYIKKRDFSFAEEYLFTSMIEKPFDGFFILRKIKDLMKERHWYDKEKAQINAVIEKTSDDKQTPLEGLYKIIATSPRLVSICLYAARRFFERGDMECAKFLIKNLLEKNPHCVLAHTMLGKIYLHQRNFDDALTSLTEAQKLSPENPERLCALGNANLQMLRTEEASEYFSQAQKLDPTFEKATSGIELSENVNSYLSDNDLAIAPTSFASLLNAIGVAMVRKQDYEKGLKHYESAIKYLDQDVLQSRLAFNLGLGFLRWKRPAEALKWFDTSARLGGDQFNKGSQYVEKLKNGIMPTTPDIDTETTSTPSKVETVMESLGSATDSNPPESESTSTSSLDFNEDSFLSENDDISASKTFETQFSKIENKKSEKKVVDPFIAQLQAFMLQLIMADRSLFKSTSSMALAETHEAYSGSFQGKKVAVFVPNTLAPKFLAKNDNLEILTTKVVILEKVGNVWQPIWPNAAAKMSA